MFNRTIFEVEVAKIAISSLIDAVHDVALRPGSRSVNKKWQFDNVTGIDTPLIADAEIDEVSRRHDVQGRPIAGISVVAQGDVAVDVLFEVRQTLATASFTGLHNTSPSAERESSFAEFLATTTVAALAAEGIDSRFRQRDVEQPSEVFDID